MFIKDSQTYLAPVTEGNQPRYFLYTLTAFLVFLGIGYTTRMASNWVANVTKRNLLSVTAEFVCTRPRSRSREDLQSRFMIRNKRGSTFRFGCDTKKVKNLLPLPIQCKGRSNADFENRVVSSRITSTLFA